MRRTLDRPPVPQSCRFVVSAVVCRVEQTLEGAIPTSRKPGPILALAILLATPCPAQLETYEWPDYVGNVDNSIIREGTERYRRFPGANCVNGPESTDEFSFLPQPSFHLHRNLFDPGQLPPLLRCDGSWVPFSINATDFTDLHNSNPVEYLPGSYTLIEHALTLSRSGSLMRGVRTHFEGSHTQLMYRLGGTFSGNRGLNIHWDLSAGTAFADEYAFDLQENSYREPGSACIFATRQVRTTRQQDAHFLADPPVLVSSVPNPSCPASATLGLYDLWYFTERLSKARTTAWDVAVANPAVTREAAAISLDPRAIGVLRLELTAPSVVTFRVAPGDAAWDDKLLYSFDANLEFGATLSPETGRTNIEAPAIEVGSRSVALAAFRAPYSGLVPYPSTPTVTIEALLANEVVARIAVGVSQPPLLLVHGVWSDPSSLQVALQTFAATYPATRLGVVDYGAFRAMAFDSAPIQQQFAIGLRSLLSEARNYGAVVHSVDIVAHSMGGLVTKEYLTRQLAAARVPALRKVVTIGSPHYGSPLAAWILSHANMSCEATGILGTLLSRWIGLPTTLEEVLAAFGNMDPSGGGADSLDPSNVRLQEIDGVEYSSIAGISPAASAVETVLNLLIAAFDGLALPMRESVDSVLGEPANDTIVPLTSQVGSAPSTYSVSDIVHAGVPIWTGAQEILGGVTVTEMEAPEVFENAISVLRGAQTGTGLPLPPDGSRSAHLHGQPPLEGLDLGAYIEVPADGLALSPASGAVLPIFEATTIAMNGLLTDVERVIYLTNAGLQEVSAAAPDLTLVPRTPGDQRVVALVLRPGSRFSVLDATYSVSSPGQIRGLLVRPRALLLEVGESAVPINVWAAFSAGLLDVTNQAAIEVQGSAIVVDAGGRLSALRGGQATVRVSYGGLERVVPVQVLDQLVFRGDFESGDTSDWY